VLSEVHEKAAIEVFEKDCLIHLGTCVAPAGPARVGKPVCKFQVEFPDGRKESGTLLGGQMLKLPLGIDPETNLPLSAQIVLEPERGFDCGAGPGARRQAKVSGGVVGIIFDGRGRPFNLSELSASDRVRKLKEWMHALDIYPEGALGQG